jgi:hypothetical protein
VGKNYLANQGVALKGVVCTCYQRQLNGLLLAPAQTIVVNAPRLFTGLNGGNPRTFIVSRTTLAFDEQNDLDHPYRVELELADHPDTGGQ